MRLNVSLGWAFPLACAAAVWGCGEGRPSSSLSPISPSALPSASAANSSVKLVPPRYVDNDGDGYEDPEPGPMPEPGQTPAPDPGQVPPPDPAQPPAVVTVNIVGSSGTAAFAPNPTQASVGNTIVWMNTDLTTHTIVLNDGTIVGNLAPGQASVPITLTSATASYRCTIHPSMTGQVSDPAAAPPTAPTDPSQTPPPASPMPPPDDYDDGYEDDYSYLRSAR
jgi:plastocyanin